jgi:hypothetical protein
MTGMVDANRRYAAAMGHDDRTRDPDPDETAVLPGDETAASEHDDSPSEDDTAALDASDDAAEDAAADQEDEFEYSDSFDVEEDADEGEDEDDGTPPLPEPVSVAVTGVLCGLVTVGFVWLAERGCDMARGTPNCGGWGLPLLLLAVATAVLAGVIMLRRLTHPNPVLISFLGVCFMLIFVVGALSNRLFTPWSVLVLPVLTAVTFLMARYVANRLNA